MLCIFGLVLLVAAVLSAPWQALWMVGALLGLCGLGGATYAFIVVRRVRRQSDYRPVLEDWLFVGIHNAWDNVTFIAIELSQRENTRQEK
jgi:hypothetical protein